jgi:cytochrome b
MVMTESVQPVPARQVEERIPVPVWDWPVRLVHWVLALLVVVSIATGFIGGGAMEWHVRSGFAVLALTLFRVLWGFAGGLHARFASFVRAPRTVVAYTRSLVRPPREVHAGHNPLGGWFVVTILAALLAQAGAGLFADDDIATAGPLAKFVSDAVSDRFTWLHARGAWVLVALVTLHVGAALVYLVAFRENLIRPMFTGVKQLPRRLAGAATGRVASLRALVLLAICALAAWGLASAS